MARRPQTSFGERLRGLMTAGQLSVSDMALALGKPRATVYTWIMERAYPRAFYMPEVERRVGILEAAIRAKNPEPLIPYNVSYLRRKGYLKDLLHAYDRRVSRQRTPV